MKKILYVLVLALLVVSGIALIRPTLCEAAKKKTVRVATQEELDKALKNSKVKTVILRTKTVDTIVISSKKAKKKELIIDAFDAKIINKTKFKKITIQFAKEYTEDVSGNTIELCEDCIYDNRLANIYIAKNRTVNKMIINASIIGWTPYPALMKGAYIKNLEFVSHGSTSVYDADTGNISIKYDTYGDGNFTNVTVETDGNGRILSIIDISDDTEYYTDIFTYEYDDNGNKTKETIARDWVGNDVNDESWIYEYDYDDDGRLLSYHQVDSLTEETRSYDDEGRLIYKKVLDATYLDETTNLFYFEYTYDKNGRVSEEHIKGYNCLKPKKVLVEWLTEYKYDDNGYVIENNITYYAAGKSIDTECYSYVYDENGNMILKITNGDETEYTYDKYGVEI